ncbi:CsbD family protein [Promineifilum sp.]|uniref:CsbD family protein n=1 Tax=Promineifilum sp. TaxID=2664178 RepID=UPI0035B1CFA7
MNDDILSGMWKQLKGQVKQQWGKLTDDDLEFIGGKRDELVGRVQERYGWEREQAEMEVENFLKSSEHSQ